MLRVIKNRFFLLSWGPESRTLRGNLKASRAWVSQRSALSADAGWAQAA